jgi:hypothetical protein
MQSDWSLVTSAIVSSGSAALVALSSVHVRSELRLNGLIFIASLPSRFTAMATASLSHSLTSAEN